MDSTFYKYINSYVAFYRISNDFFFERLTEYASDLFVLNAKEGIFHLYHGENQLDFSELMIMSAVY